MEKEKKSLIFYCPHIHFIATNYMKYSDTLALLVVETVKPEELHSTVRQSSMGL